MMWIWGHRGSHDGVSLLENTLPAFEQAVAEGADGVELDVRLSADGVAFVSHDASLGRLTGGRDPRRLSAVTAAELRALELPGGHRMPTLAEALDLLLGRLPVNVELKEVEAVAPTLADLRRARRGEVLFSSFVPQALDLLQAGAPAVPRAVLMEAAWAAGVTDELLFARLAALAAHRWNVDPPLAEARRVEALRARGVEVHVWTVNDPGEARALAAAGVAGVFTDRPASMRAALQSEPAARHD